MAIFKTGMADQGRGFTPFPQGTIGVRRAAFTTTANPAAGDVYQMIPVYTDEVVHDLQLIIPAIPDTNATETIVFDVGDGVDTNRYIDGTDTDVPEGGFVRLGSGIATAAAAANLTHVYTADDTIDILIETVAATPVAATQMELVAFIGN